MTTAVEMVQEINLAELTREDAKDGVVTRLMVGDVVGAAMFLGFFEEFIAEEGFESVEEINQYYKVKRLVDSN